MALAQPPGQQRNAFGRDYGNYASVAAMPNGSGNVLPSATVPFTLEAGDRCYLTTTSLEYICTNPGTAGGGNAVWTVNGQDQDRFAPKYLVGNVPAGDTASSYSNAGFIYISDPGNGTGIAAALLAAATTAGDVWIRPGAYALTTRLTIPSGVTVRGAGVGLVTINSGTVDKCAFQMGDSTSIFDLSILDLNAGAAVGSAVIEGPNGAAGNVQRTLRGLSITVVTANLIPISLVGGAIEIASCRVRRTSGSGLGPLIEGGAANPAFVDIHNNSFNGFTTSVITMGASSAVNDSRIVENRFTTGAGVIPIVLGANVSNSIVLANVSRGSTSTLPTDAGTGNSLVNNIWGA